MKRPYIDYIDRQIVYENTISGAFIMLGFRFKVFCRNSINTLSNILKQSK